LYIFTGSIWVPIVGHILLDALQGLSLFEILRKDAPPPSTQPA
jgi:membrane protease YdiL (CAAX protease family)